jgi:hypothetical protein
VYLDSDSVDRCKELLGVSKTEDELELQRKQVRLFLEGNGGRAGIK